MSIATFAEARRIVEAQASALKPDGIETIPLLDARGRVLAEAIFADRDFPPFPRMVIWPVLQSISSKFSPATSPARTPSRASSNRMAWFLLPTDVFRSQHSRTRSTVAAGRNLGIVESDQLGTVGTQPARSVVIAPRYRR